MGVTNNGKSANTQKPARKPYRQVTTSDVFYRHGGKFAGFFVILVLGGIALLRAEPADIPKVLQSIFTSNAFFWMGWFFAVIILISALIIGYIMFRKYPKELDRVCKERDRLQEKLTGKQVRHTEGGE